MHTLLSLPTARTAASTGLHKAIIASNLWPATHGIEFISSFLHSSIYHTMRPLCSLNIFGWVIEWNRWYYEWGTFLLDLVFILFFLKCGLQTYFVLIQITETSIKTCLFASTMQQAKNQSNCNLQIDDVTFSNFHTPSFCECIHTSY